MLSDAVNPSLTPAAYPGTVVTSSCVVTRSRLHRLVPHDTGTIGDWSTMFDGDGDGRRGTVVALDDFLNHAGTAPISERHPVLAIGSNAAPGQLRHKLARHGVSCVVPALRASVAGIAVGHSAHVSRAGYLPYAPYGDPYRSRDAVLLWFDDQQLARVNATEVNYTPTVLTADRYPLALEAGHTVPGYLIYRGNHGVLRLDADSMPVDATTQARILARLCTQPGFVDLLPEIGTDVDAAVQALQDSEQRRNRVSDYLARSAVPDGLTSQDGL